MTTSEEKQPQNPSLCEEGLFWKIKSSQICTLSVINVYMLTFCLVLGLKSLGLKLEFLIIFVLFCF